MFMDMINLFEQNMLFRLIILFILGAIIGSFLNVVIFRLPVILRNRWQRDCLDMLESQESDILIDVNTKEDIQDKELAKYSDKSFSLLYPASHCPHCKCKVPYWANIPLIGFFLTRMRCVKCKEKISVQYPVVELMTASLYLCAGIIVADSWILLCYLVFISFVICLVFIDYNTYLLPDELTLLLLWLGLLVNINGWVALSLKAAVIGAALGYASLWLIYWVYKLITKKEGMGYGDFKFLAAILAWLGYPAFIPILLISPLLAIIYFTIMRLFYRLRLDQPIPFGPFLGIAALVVLSISKTGLLEYWSIM